MNKLVNSLVLVALSLVCRLATAQVVEPIDKNKIANGGYDLVAYFSDNAAKKGKKEFTEEYNGVKYLFASIEHKNLFIANPEKYLPMCDGYCAWGVAEKGKKVPVNPETFKVIDNKLYLFFNGDFSGKPFNTLPEWNKNEAKLLTQLPLNWAKLKK